MDDLIGNPRMKARLVQNPDGTISVVGSGVRQEDEPTTIVRVNRIPQPGATVKVDPKDTLMAAARMQRDGASLAQIREYLGSPMERMPNKNIPGDMGSPMPDSILQRAINVGHEMLQQGIASGQEPEETIVDVRIPTAMWLEGEMDEEDDDD